MVEGWTLTAVASYVQLPILNTSITEAGNNEVGKGNLLSLIAILWCILDYIWMNWNPGGWLHLWVIFLNSFELGRSTFSLNLLRWDGAPLIWNTPSGGSRNKGHGSQNKESFACLFLWASSSLHGHWSLLLRDSGVYWDNQFHGLYKYWFW